MQGDYDVIVVGAGPAGTSAALHGSRLGLKTLLLDKKTFPREKSCGDALSSASLACLEELGLLEELLRESFVKVSEISYFSPSGNSVTVPLLKLDKSLPVTGVICRRVILDDLLFQAAKKEVEVIDWCAVKEVIIEDGRAVGVKAELGGGRECEFRARAVVGADGANSVVARRMGVKQYPEHRSVAAQAYYRLVTGTMGMLEIHFVEEVLPGFVWIYPTESGMTNVGLSLPLTSLKQKAFRPRKTLESVIRSPLLRERFAFAERMGEIEVSIIPLGHTMRQVHGEGFMLAGDAAGLIHPCSSEGVSGALISGELAAKVLAEAMENNDFSRKGLSRYPQLLWNRLGPTLRMADRLLALRTPKAIDSLIRSARRRPHNAGWISGVLIGSALPSEELASLLDYLDFFSR